MRESVIRQKGNYLHVYLGKHKNRWIDYCKGHSEKPGVAIKRIICSLMSGEEKSTSAASAIVGKADRSRNRVEVRLAYSEYKALNKLSERDGLTINQYLVQLARHHILKNPQFNISEIETFRESNVQLMGLGRNLNQIARALNAEDPDEHRPTVKDIKALSEKIYQHTYMVSNLIRANLERWKIE
jgi:hypothetical protein